MVHMVTSIFAWSRAWLKRRTNHGRCIWTSLRTQSDRSHRESSIIVEYGGKCTAEQNVNHGAMTEADDPT